MSHFIDYFNLTTLEHFHFLRPYWFFVFIFIIFILRFFSQREDTLSVWRNVMSPTILKALTVQGNTERWLSPPKLSLIISIPLCLVLMGPTWQQMPSPFSEDEAVLIIALDLSETMEQNDLAPSRLLRAKQKILQLLEHRGDAKTALVAFAGSAHVVMPITNDREMIRHFLDSLSLQLMPVTGKLTQSILPVSNKLLSSTTVPSTLLLLTDGTTQESTNAFRQSFTNQGSLYHNQLIVWAIGKTQSQLTEHSQIVPVQIAQLENLVNATSGRLVTMTIDEEDVKQVSRYIEHNLVIVDDKSRPWLDSGYPFTFIVALLFLFWFRKGWTLQW